MASGVRGSRRQIRILADPFEFHQTQRSDRVLGVDYDSEVRSTLHRILWRQEPNRGYIRILVDPFEFHQTQCSNRVLDVDWDDKVRLTLHTIFWCQESIEVTSDIFGLWRTPSNSIKLNVLKEFRRLRW